MVSVTAVLLVALTVEGLPAQSYYKSSSSSSSLDRRDTSSLLYVWLCRLSRNLLRALKGHKGMNTAPLTDPNLLTERASPPRRLPLCTSRTPRLMSPGGGGRDGVRWIAPVSSHLKRVTSTHLTDAPSRFSAPRRASSRFLFPGLDLVCPLWGENFEYFRTKENK